MKSSLSSQLAWKEESAGVGGAEGGPVAETGKRAGALGTGGEVTAENSGICSPAGQC